MRKIKDNGRTLVQVKRRGCFYCYYRNNGRCPCPGNNMMWRETLPSKLSRLIKRIIQVRNEKQLRKRMQKMPMRSPKDDPEIHRIVAESFWDYF